MKRQNVKWVYREMTTPIVGQGLCSCRLLGMERSVDKAQKGGAAPTAKKYGGFLSKLPFSLRPPQAIDTK